MSSGKMLQKPGLTSATIKQIRWGVVSDISKNRADKEREHSLTLAVIKDKKILTCNC